jgi:uncharacterized membrane protein YccC
MLPEALTRHHRRIFPSAASPHVPTCTFPRAVFTRPDAPETAQRWRDRGAGLLVGLALAAAVWWGWA